MVEGSPAWKPQATFALLTMPSRASSSPSCQTPKPSPRSAFRSIRRPLVTRAVSHRGRCSDRVTDEATGRGSARATCRQSVFGVTLSVCDRWTGPRTVLRGQRLFTDEEVPVPTSGVAAPALLEALPDVVVVADVRGRIVYTNPVVAALLGHEP